MTPIDLPRLTDLPQLDEAYRERMLWGTYRCGQYLGARHRLSQLPSILVGSATVCKAPVIALCCDTLNRQQVAVLWLGDAAL